jgi:creatinine amidohydrolase
LAYSAMTSIPGSFPRLTGNGVWGNPTGAKVEKGIKLLQEIVDNIKTVIFELQ